MSFRCDVCHQYGEGSPTRVVTKYRERPMFAGSEIASEVNAHSECAAKVRAPRPSVGVEAEGGPLTTAIGELTT